MRLIYHDAGGGSAAAAFDQQRMATLLATTGHEVLPLEDAGDAPEAAACVVELRGSGIGESVAWAWAEARGLPLVCLEPDTSEARAGRPGTLKAHLERAAGVVTYEPRAHDLLHELLSGDRRLHRFAPFCDIGPYLSSARDAKTHRKTLAGRLLCPEAAFWLLTAAQMLPGDSLRSYRQWSQALTHLVHENWFLLVLGDGPARPEVEAAFRHLPRQRLRFLGALSAMLRQAVFAASDLFVWPASGAACGWELLQAQAAGLPVVGEKNAFVPHYVADGVTGRLSIPGNFMSLANNVAFLMRHENFRESYGREALRSTPELFGCSRAAVDFNRALGAIVSAG